MNSSSINYSWKLHQPDEKLVRLLVRKAGLIEPIAHVLANRGIKNENEARQFLNPTLKNLHPPDELPDIEVSSERIIKAVKDRERIVVYGDYDADGVTSTALLVSFLQNIGAIVSTYQPDRLKEGYGLNVDALSRLLSEGVDLVVAVDLGVADAKAVEWASSRGIDVIVVDHHQVPEQMPDAVAVVDPHRSLDEGVFHPLSGVGLAFYLAAHVRSRIAEDKFFNNLETPDLRRALDLVALGTIADMAPLSGLNRIMVTHGLKEIGAERRLGIAALKAQAHLERKKITAGQVAFQLAPRLNAAGRMGDAALAVELLITEDYKEARRLARKMDKFNRERQRTEMEIQAEAVRMIERESLADNPAIVLAGPGWHPGVIGIVASRLMDTYAVPVVIIGLDGEEGKGSVRSLGQVHAYKALASCSEFLEGYGGHAMAGGLFIKADAVEGFRKKFCEAVEKYGVQAGRGLKLDMKLDPEDVDASLAREVARLAPYGVGNPEPLFFASGVSCHSVRKMGSDHLRFRVQRGRGEIEAVAFRLADRVKELEGPVDLAYTPVINEWENWERVEMKVKDFRPAGDPV